MRRLHNLSAPGGVNVNQIGFGSSSCLNIVNRAIRRYPKLNVTGERVALRFINPDMKNLEGWMKRCIIDLLSTIGSDLNIKPSDRVGINFANENDEKINFAFSSRRFDQYTPRLILKGLENVLQSNTQFLLEDCLMIKVDHYSPPSGYGRRTHIGKTTEQYFKLHKSSIFNPELAPEHNTVFSCEHSCSYWLCNEH